MTTVKNKIGLILCKCGTNIQDAIDFDAVLAWAKKHPSISAVFEHEFLCSPEGQACLKSLLIENQLDKLVLAACSPRERLAFFGKIAEEAGMNLGDVQLANIREHCTWVTPDKNEATQKTKAIINAAVARVARQEKLERRSLECITDLVVIGGGIAGIEAALLASQAGRKVTLIEKNISLGGRVIQTEELAPTMECSPCMLSPRLFAVKEDPNIRVLANTDVTKVVGFQGNFKVSVRKRARYVTDSCIGCEACFEACPVSVASEFHLGLGQRKAVYTLFPGAVPAMAAIDKQHCLHFQKGSCQACADACPFSAIRFDEQDEEFDIPAGAIILAVGAAPFDTKAISRLGHGRIPGVYTLQEFERLINSNGPTQGKLLVKNKAPKSVAVIHCAGSLTRKGLEYCSGICCVTALKVGEVLRKQNPKVKVYHLHDRLVLTDREQNEFYAGQKKAGTQFLPTPNLEAITLTKSPSGIQVKVPGRRPLAVDAVVLATGLQPSREARALGEQLGIDFKPDGFFKSDHPFLRRLSSSLEGIYQIGACAGPCLADAAVIQAQAAAGEIISRLIPGKKVELEILTSSIDPGICAGCEICVPLCPYQAIEYHADTHVCEINEAICRGCGTCVAACPNGAAAAKNFTRAQIAAELEGLLHG